LTDPVNLLS